MKLKNIYSRRDFKKVYENFGANEGGAGEHNGFANNLKWKETYLGMLVNGIFGKLGALLKKSGIFFTVNKLIAQYIKELLRGVIIFCFEKDINLKGEETPVTDLSTDTSSDQTGNDNEERKKMIRTIAVDSHNNQVTTGSNSLSAVSIYKSVEPTYINKIKRGDIFSFINKDNDFENVVISSVDVNSGKAKYYKNGGDIVIDDISELKFTPIANQAHNKLEAVTKNPIIERYTDLKKILDKYATNYNELDNGNKRKIQEIYQNLVLLKRFLDIIHVDVDINENYNLDNFDLINEDSPFKQNKFSTKKLSNDSKAGSGMSLGKKVATKTSLGAIKANVGDILTKKDKEKYKEKKELFNIGINDINLAAIEKKIEELDKPKDDDDTNGSRDEKTSMRDVVSSHVNAYNLKVLQLTASELFIEKDNTDNNKLKIEWNKKVAGVLAAFRLLMNAEKVDISDNNTHLGADEDLNKAKKSANTKGQELKNDEKLSKIIRELDIEETLVKFNAFKNISNYSNRYYYAFSYENILYNAILTPVISSATTNSEDYVIARVVRFVGVDDTGNIVDKDDLFDKFRKNPNNDLYFLISKSEYEKKAERKIIILNIDNSNNNDISIKNRSDQNYDKLNNITATSWSIIHSTYSLPFKKSMILDASTIDNKYNRFKDDSKINNYNSVVISLNSILTAKIDTLTN